MKIQHIVKATKRRIRQACLRNKAPHWSKNHRNPAVESAVRRGENRGCYDD